jgi:pimeloyl-ACP methyl ester carboxylesterase
MVENPLVFVPGLLCDRRLWEEQIESLGSARETVVANTLHDASIPDMARRILEEAPERFLLAGLSMGGYVALEVMRQSPERVERLALLDTSARPDTPEQTEARLELVRLARKSGLETVARELIPRLLHPSRLEDEKLVSTITGMALATGFEAFERQERAIIARNDTREILPLIECPTLVLCGREDRITPVAFHEELAENIPDARLRVIEKCGHLSTLERPDEVNIALREWLA